jgi:hypothetical protein
MKFYIFSKKIKEVKELIDHRYDGALFVYSTSVGDFFTQVSRTMNLNESFKYMVAVRPYAISPQYLFMINDSINNIDKNRLQINLINGSSVNKEVKSGEFLGEMNDLSPQINKSNYLISYVNMLESHDKKTPDYYISVRDELVVNETLKHNSKLLISYEDYKDKTYNIENRDVMIHLWAILRETKEELKDLQNKNSKVYPEILKPHYFTNKEFENLLIEFNNKKIDSVLFYTFWDEKERHKINKFVKKYKEKELI